MSNNDRNEGGGLFENRDDGPGPLGLQRGEYAAAVVTGSVALVVGVWAGLWLVPDAALAVPTETIHGHETPAYTPVPGFLPLASVGIVVFGGWNAWTTLRASQEDREAERREEGSHDA
jgi:hypothetical protein